MQAVVACQGLGQNMAISFMRDWAFVPTITKALAETRAAGGTLREIKAAGGMAGFQDLVALTPSSIAFKPAFGFAEHAQGAEFLIGKAAHPLSLARRPINGPHLLSYQPDALFSDAARTAREAEDLIHSGRVSIRRAAVADGLAGVISRSRQPGNELVHVSDEILDDSIRRFDEAERLLDRSLMLHQ